MQYNTANTPAAKTAKVWASGDFMYGAVNTYSAPSGTVHMLINGRELPVAKLQSNGLDTNDNIIWTVARWISRDERFPEPIKGFNV